jgi:hypothetical protein
MSDSLPFTTCGWQNGNGSQLKKILNKLASLETQITHQARTTLVANLNTEGLIFDQALSLGADLSLAACSLAGRETTFNLMVSRGLASGLLLGLHEVGEDLYNGAYLAMRGIMAGASLSDTNVCDIALAGSLAILKISEQHGANREMIIKKMAAGATDTNYACTFDAEAIERLFLDMFELIDQTH